MIGLAQMAWALAQNRRYPSSRPEKLDHFGIVPRRFLGEYAETFASAEYYRIIDRLSRGEAP